MLSSLSDSSVGAKNHKAVDLFPMQLLFEISKLPIRHKEVLEMYDFDDTLWNSNRRFDVDRLLENYRGDLAIEYIRKAYGDSTDPTGLREFVALLQVDRHLFDTEKFYEPENPQHVILTAGHSDLQRMKIESAGYTYAKRILVRDAKNKPLAILRYILKLGYIPGKIKFTDDRIENFDGIDDLLAEILKVSVVFQKAIPNPGNSSVELVRVTERRAQLTIAANDSLIHNSRRIGDKVLLDC